MVFMTVKFMMLLRYKLWLPQLVGTPVLRALNSTYWNGTGFYNRAQNVVSILNIVLLRACYAQI
ncbi:hypothetical protein D2E26_0713 [Bifidobacterium dolichotidis]|uniref:Uncharacterized protein n=1 Tax=Bifidobacterium dolichotidis TaxID=2306976 RepID=A0A430FTF2_9BIFI|nr:hypothetical protein D2E26_0713 [Bifidobacterium dolichotidis]